MSSKTFDLASGSLTLDFANTVDWHASDCPEDRLEDINDLIDWGAATQILQGGQVQKLVQQAAERPEEAARVLAQAKQLREAIYRLFSGQALQGLIQADDLVLLNKALQDAQAQRQIVHTGAGFEWGWVVDQAGFGQIIRPIAHSAGELLTSDLLERVSQCADDRGCGYLFVDTSRNRSRRWCSMEVCGNRAKARRHYHRQQSG